MNYYSNKIAIVGIGCRFPGRIFSPEDFWNFLVENGNGITETPSDRWSIDKYYSPDKSAKGKVYTKNGGFINNIDKFDPQFFGISPKEAAQMDPQQRLLIEVTKEALEDAGIPIEKVSGAKAGAYVGLFMHDFESLQKSAGAEYFTPQSVTAASTTIAANRISYCFNLLGPSMVIDTACSSSLVAIHLARKSLLSSETEICFAGGVNIMLVPESTMLSCEAEMLSPDGLCKSFDARADGYARAEGAAILVLKTLEKALRDNDNIYAVISGSAVNQDGKTSGITVPNPLAQVNVINDALNDAGVKPSDVGYVEAHGTGTPVGDPAELSAIAEAISKKRISKEKLLVGSVKSNFGHTESAAGVAGVIKAALVLKNGKIPANLHFITPNPKIPFDKFKIQVPVSLTDFPKNKKIACVNSFGFGGTNAHVILTKYKPRSKRKSKNKNLIIPLSAKDPETLKTYIERVDEFVSQDKKINLYDVGYSAALRRDHYEYRAAFVCKSKNDFLTQLNTFSGNDIYRSDKTRKLVFVFSGMGQQWEKMALKLYHSQPVFQKTIHNCAALFKKMPDKWNLIDTLLNGNFDNPTNAQRSIFSVQVALFELFKSKTILPDKIVGHSVGEIAAAYSAGIFSLNQAVEICYHRSRLQEKNTGKGKMLAVAISKRKADTICKKYKDKIFVAAINSPNAVTLSGDSATLEKISLQMKNKNVFARMLNVDVPYHSPIMKNIISELRKSLSGIKPAAAKIPLVSTVTAEFLNGTEMNAKYWCDNVRKPVDFLSALKKLKKNDVFVELAAHPVLSSYISESLDGKIHIPVMKRGKDSAAAFLHSVAKLYQAGIEINWDLFYDAPGNLIGLPKHPLRYQRYWYEPEEHYNARTGLVSSKRAGSENFHFAGEKTAGAIPSWRVKLNNYKLEYLKDHIVEKTAVFPAAAYIEFAVEAGMNTGKTLPFTLSNTKFLYPLIINSGSEIELTADKYDFKIFSKDANVKASDDWHLNATGSYELFSKKKARKNIEQIKNRCKNRINKNQFYSVLSEAGFDYGFNFRNVDCVFTSDKEKIGLVKVNPALSLNSAVVHPALLDSAFQVAAAADKGKYVPVSVEKISIFSAIKNDFYVYVKITAKNLKFVKCDILLLAENGEILVDISGFKCKSLEYEEIVDINDYFYDYVWVSKPLDDENFYKSFLPTSASIKKRITPLVKKNAAAFSRNFFYREIEPLLNRLALEYIISALYKLGWSFDEKKSFNVKYLAKKLGIKEKYELLLNRYLNFLTEKRFLQKDNDKFIIKKRPENKNPVNLWRKIFINFPSYFIDFFVLQTCGAKLPEILKGKIDPIDVIFPKNLSVMEHFYRSSYNQIFYNEIIADIFSEIISPYSNKNTLDILEVGGGTASIAAVVAPKLPPAKSRYLFTDISKMFINSAKQKLEKYNFIDFAVFDIEKEPVKQNLKEKSFDVILASNVIHATADVKKSIYNLKKLLKPGGILIALEVTKPGFWYDVTFGLLPGTRLFTDKEIRKEHALPSEEKWIKIFNECGFDKCEVINDSAGDFKAISSIFILKNNDKPKKNKIEIVQKKQLFLIGKKNSLSKQLVKIAAELNLSLKQVESEAELKKFKNIDKFTVIDIRNTARINRKIKSASINNLVSDECVNTVQILKTIDKFNYNADYRLITSNAVTVDDDDEINIVQAPLWGLAHTVLEELNNINFKIIDISNNPSRTDLRNLIAEVLSDSAEDEIAFRNNRRYVRRLTLVPPRGKIDFVARKGKGQSTKIVECNRQKMSSDAIEIKNKFTGVNFKDAAIVSNLLDNIDSDTDFRLGLEGSGIISRVGKNIKKFKPGDEIVFLITDCFSNFSYCSENLLMRKPKNISFAEGALLPIAFLTAYYSLEKLAHLKKNESVLIHTATGGVGLAAIQVAKNIGAKIFCTAGSQEKRNFLFSLGVTCIGSSRDFSFADNIMKITRGEGVDVVLNTLPSEFIGKNISILKTSTGRIIDISNIHYDNAVKTSLFRKGVSFFSVNLSDMINEKPEIIKNLFNELYQKFSKNIYKPLPYRIFSFNELDEAIKNISKAKHIGKYVIDIQKNDVVPVPDNEKIKVKSQGSYVIVGGTSGLGFATAEWLADCGAKNIVLVGRSKAKVKKIQNKINLLRARGINLEIFYADVSNFIQIKNVFEEINKKMPRVKGVILSAMVLNDKSLLKLTKTDFNKVLNPKVMGAWNLHLLTKNQNLDFFICFSSFVSLIGNRGQANYGAANSFLDALAVYRRKMKLPALTIGLGMISDVGFIADNSNVRDLIQGIGINSITRNQIFKALVRLINCKTSYAGFVNIDWKRLARKVSYIASTPKFSLFTKQIINEKLSSAGLTGEVVSVLKNEPETKEYLTKVIKNLVAQSLGLQVISSDVRLDSIGLDSLISVELADKIQKTFDVKLSRMVLLQNGLTVQALVDVVMKHLPEKFTVRKESQKTDTEILTAKPAVKKAFEFPAEFVEMKKNKERNKLASAYFIPADGVNNNLTKINGKQFINFCSYNYLGLSGEKDIARAVALAVEKYGTSVSASRIVSGERPLHRRLEQEIAGFIGTEDCLVFISGYETNETVIGNLMTKDDVIFYDSFVHSSIREGAKLSGARVVSFPHNNFNALNALMKTHRNNFRHALVVIEGVYSMDGDIPNLPQFIKIKNENKAMLMVDEAHSIGVLGKTGRGISEHFNVNPDEVELWMGTLSKAFASAGGYIAAKKEMIEFLKFTVPGFIYSVGLSPANTAAALASIEKIKKEPERVERLQSNAELFLNLAKKKGINTGTASGSAVVPVIPGNTKKCMELYEKLYQNDVFALPVVYPAVPENAARIRFFISSTHTEKQIKYTCNLL